MGFFDYSCGFKWAGLPFLLLLWINEGQLSEPQQLWSQRHSVRPASYSSPSGSPPSLPFTDQGLPILHCRQRILSKVTVTLAIFVRATVLHLWKEAQISARWWPWADLNWTNTKLEIETCQTSFMLVVFSNLVPFLATPHSPQRVQAFLWLRSLWLPCCLLSGLQSASRVA